MVSRKTITLTTLILCILLRMEPALAQSLPIELGFDATLAKYVSVTMAFATAAFAAGWAVGKVGAVGMASAAQRPETKTTAVIIAALGEALAVYGLVISILILQY